MSSEQMQVSKPGKPSSKSRSVNAKPRCRPFRSNVAMPVRRSRMQRDGGTEDWGGGAMPRRLDLKRPIVGSRKLEYDLGRFSFVRLRSEGGHIPTFWLLLYHEGPAALRQCPLCNSCTFAVKGVLSMAHMGGPPQKKNTGSPGRSCRAISRSA